MMIYDHSDKTLRDALEAILEGDTALMSIATGGVFDVADLPQTGMTADDLPYDANSPLVQPFIVIAIGDEPRFGPERLLAARADLEFYCHQHRGYDKIDSMVDRLMQMFNDAHIHTSDRGLAHTHWIHNSRQLPAGEDALANIPMRFCRFGLTTTRIRS